MGGAKGAGALLWSVQQETVRCVRASTVPTQLCERGSDRRGSPSPACRLTHDADRWFCEVDGGGRHL